MFWSKTTSLINVSNVTDVSNWNDLLILFVTDRDICQYKVLIKVQPNFLEGVHSPLKLDRGLYYTKGKNSCDIYVICGQFAHILISLFFL